MTKQELVERLKEICIKEGYMPTLADLLDMDRMDLIIGMNYWNLSVIECGKELVFELKETPKGYWTNIENIKREFKPLIQNNKLPSLKKIRDNLGHRAVTVIYEIHGGMEKVCELLGCDKSDNKVVPVNKKWTESVIFDTIQKYIDKYGEFPTKTQLEKLKDPEFHGLGEAVKKKGGFLHFRDLFGVEQKHKFGYWNEETIILKLKECMEILGHYPSQNDIIYVLKIPGMHNAIMSHGGYMKFRELLQEPIKEKESKYNEKVFIDGILSMAKEIGCVPSYAIARQMNPALISALGRSKEHSFTEIKSKVQAIFYKKG